MRLLLTIIICLFPTISSALTLGIQSTLTGTGGSSCTGTIFAQNTTVDTNTSFAVDAGSWYVGYQVESGSGTYTMCTIDWYIRAKQGNPDSQGYTYRIEVWSVDGSNYLSTLKGATSAIASSALTVQAYNTFTFSTPVSVAATDAVVIVRADGGAADATNYVQGRYTASDADSSYAHYAKWTQTTKQRNTNQTSWDIGYKAHE